MFKVTMPQTISKQLVERLAEVRANQQARVEAQLAMRAAKKEKAVKQ